jgi:hypothetical protein
MCLLLLALLLSGCATSSTRTGQGAGETPVKIEPDPRIYGRIASVNERGQFVVVDFNVAGVPPLPARLNVYREREMVAVVRLTGPRDDNLVAGDIVSGEVRVGDEAVWEAAVPARGDGDPR